jgi:hypothetical protein
MKLDKIKRMNKTKIDSLNKDSEHTIQTNCNDWCKRNNILLFSVPNEATRGNYNYKKSGVLNGVSDTIVVLPGKVLFIEFKDHKGAQSKSQKKFEKEIKNLGLSYFIVRSLNEFKKLINEQRSE